MQTFLPYKDFRKSAECLDRHRLGKQRLEAMQILRILVREATEGPGVKIGYSNHPAVAMWRGHYRTLHRYATDVCKAWIARGYKDTCLQKINDLYESMYDMSYVQHCVPVDDPRWLGDEKFHSSHRSILLKKNFDYYSKFDWTDDPSIVCYWPVRSSSKI